jgi:hypothetical protein
MILLGLVLLKYLVEDFQTAGKQYAIAWKLCKTVQILMSLTSTGRS